MIGLTLLVAILATRIPLLLWDRPIKARQAALAGATQALVILALLHASYGCLTLLALLGVGNLVWYLAERRYPASLQPIRLLTLVGFALLATTLGSPAFHLSFRDLESALFLLQPWFSPVAGLDQLPWRMLLTTATGLLLCLNEANLVIRLIINRLELKPEAPGTPDLVINQEYQRGRVIGILERIVLFVLVFTGQYSAVGFVLAAKAMARFKTLDDRDFAEYFLIGTLLSITLAGGLALGVKAALA